MGDKTGIQWADATWNPVTGCTKISQGCKHCYAERDWPRLVHLPAYKGRTFADVACHPERLDQPLRWAKPRRIFVNSMSDLFHEDVPDIFIDLVFAAMAMASQHSFQVLTKRPRRMLEYMSAGGRGAAVLEIARISEHSYLYCAVNQPPRSWPLPNVWLGVSVEDQPTADERIPLLLQTPAAVRWISAEPLLAPVDLRFERLAEWNKLLCEHNGDADGTHIHWVVVGGESGPKARPMHPDWARSLRDQCAIAGVPFFVKQLHDDAGKLIKDISTLPSDLQIREYPNE